MRLRLALIILCATSLSAQTSVFCVTALLDTYLGLVCGSPPWIAIERNNNEHRTWRDRKEQRIYQVRGELDEETRRSPLDPTALGLRYAEIEAICREIDDREKQLVVVNHNALSEAQKTKLAALEAAMLLVQTGNQASLRHLIDSDPVGPVLLLPVGAIYTPVLTKRRTGACTIPASNVLPLARVAVP